MEDCCKEIMDATKNYNENSFIKNHVLRIAVVKWIEIIGEASTHISETIKQKYAEINWV